MRRVKKTGLSRTESYVPGKTGQAVQIDSADAELIYSAVDNLDKARGSIALWVKCSWEEDSRTPHAFFWENGPRKAGFNSIWIWKYGNTLRFDVRDPQDRFVTTDITHWKTDEWHYIVCTWDNQTGHTLYIDGKCCAGGASDKSKRRHVSIYYEDPDLCHDFGNLNTMPGFETLIDRLITYMHYSGQDTFMYPGVWYHGPLYPSKSQGVVMPRPHPNNFIEYLLLRFEAENISFIPTINLHSLPSLAHHKWKPGMTFSGAAAEGALAVGWDGSPNLRGWHGTRPDYNIYHPEVRAAILTMIDEMLELYGDSKAFKGICFHLTKHCMLWFGNLDGGYNDICVETFEKESGIKIPVSNDDPMRVPKRYRWIRENAREPWTDWRCKVLRSFYGEIAARLADKRPDLKLVLALYRPVFRDIYPDPGKVPSNDFVRQINREGGIDPLL